MDTRTSSPYEPLPHNRCTRILEVLQSTPLEREKLVLRMGILDLDLIEAPSDSGEDASVQGAKEALQEAVREAPQRAAEKPSENPHSKQPVLRYDALSYTWGAPQSTPECEAEYGPANDVDIAVLSRGDVRYGIRIGP